LKHLLSNLLDFIKEFIRNLMDLMAFIQQSSEGLRTSLGIDHCGTLGFP
jgi:hypothetical protein